MQLSQLTQYLIYQLYHARLLIRKIGSEDAEALHQFRISVRKVRSLYKLYPMDAIVFPKNLKTFLRTTNSLRELDVFLHSLDPIKHPETYHHLEKIQRKEYSAVLTDDFKQQLIQTIDAFYNQITECNPTLTEELLVNTALDHYAQSVAMYHSLPQFPSNKKLHDLRIRFKISRYGLEFLHESFIMSEKEKISECKQFQNQFGEIQDLANQVHWLKKFCEMHPDYAFEKLLKKRKKQLKKLKGSS